MEQRVERATAELTDLQVALARLKARITRAGSRSRGAATAMSRECAERSHSQVDVTRETAPWCMQSSQWPVAGQVILAHYNQSSIVVYAAFNKSIASWAVEHQKFGGPDFLTDRLTWIKPNFLWMMYRCGWALKDANQTNVLAITMSRDAFDEILWQTWPTSYRQNQGPFTTNDEWKAAKPEKGHGVQMQWDPDHSPCGGKLERRAIQLGLSPHVQQTLFNTEHCIRRIDDITEFVSEQRARLIAGGGGAGVGEKRKGNAERQDTSATECSWRVDMEFVLPTERPYVVRNVELASMVCVTGESWPGSPNADDTAS
eukprot:m.38818 g.38818  ORF g.38818 m.38818 type:complete len:315 (+) comp13513_c0_seq1:190-1134(+)